MRFSLRSALFLSAFFLPAALAAASGGRVMSSPPTEVARLRCTAQVEEGHVSCVRQDADAASGTQGVSLAGQHGRYLGDAHIWAADVALHNPTSLVFGAADGTAVLSGIQVHVLGAPRTSAGAGSVAMLSAKQPVFQYEGTLQPGETSGARTWQFDVPQTVQAFTFEVSVVATVSIPMPWANLTAPSPMGMAGTTQVLTGAARTRNGVLVPGALRTWATSDPAIATVSATGSVTSMAPGTATITASVNGLPAGTSSISVCPGLNVGEVYHFSTAAGASFCLGGGNAATAEYTVIPTNGSTTTSIPLTFVANGIVGGTSAVPASAFAEPQPAAAFEASALLLPDRPADVREADVAHLEARARDRQEVASLLDGQPLRSLARTATASAVPVIGDVLSFNVASGCTGTRDVRSGEVRAVTDHIIAVHDTANPTGDNYVSGSSYYRLDSLAAQAERIAWSSITPAFGTPTDLDGNGRVILFFTRAVNELSPPASSTINPGYFASRDLFPASECNLSNEGEVLYMMVPDPTGAVNSNVRTVSTVVGQTTRIAGHQLQHLINASRRLHVTGAPTLEESWLDEGLSFVAEELMFYHESFGLAPRGNINLSMLTSGTNASRRVAAFNTYINQNFGRLRSFLQRPDTTGAFKSGALTTSQVMSLGRSGATWSFLRYAADRRNGDDNALWAALGGTATIAGQANLQTALGLTADELDTWYRDWTVALYTDDTVVPGVAAIHQTTSWNFRSVYGGLGGFPLLARSLSNATPLALTFSSGGSTSFLRVGVATGTFATLHTTTGGVPPGSDVGITVVRTK